MRKTTWVKIDDFKIDDTSTEYIVLEIDEPLIPKASITRTMVAGRNGQKVSKKGYENKQVVISIGVYGNTSQEINERIVKLFNTIGVDKKVKLVIGDSPNKYYDASIIDICDSKINSGITQVNLNFECSFCKYELYDDSKDYKADSPLTIESIGGVLINRISLPNTSGIANVTINNKGTFQSNPMITITGTAGSVTIHDSKTSIRVKDINKEVIYLNSDNMTVYTELNGVKTSALQRTSGNFITLDAGNNEIAVSVTDGLVDIDFVHRNAYLV